MNPKINKIEADLMKTNQKISALQDHMRELEQQKTELENTDIVGLVRDAGMRPQELAALLRALADKGGASAKEETNHED